MHKLIALYKRPEDPEAFIRAYQETHLPLVAQFPNLRRVELNRVTGAPGSEPEYYLIAEMFFDTREHMMEALNSDVSRQAAKTLNSFARGLVTMVFAETADEPEQT
jgi:uncharacterized protein (TIGR02118 family)